MPGPTPYLSFNLHINNIHLTLYIWGYKDWKSQQNKVGDFVMVIIILPYRTQMVHDKYLSKEYTRCSERVWVLVWLQLMLIHLFIHSTNTHSVPKICQTLNARNTAVNWTNQNFCLHGISNLVILIRTVCSPSKYSAFLKCGILRQYRLLSHNLWI